MPRSTLDDAFAHHVWATLRLIDACQPLDRAQLATTVPGTFGSILDTLRHLVGSDASYLFVTTGGQVQPIDEDELDVPQLRSVMVAHGSAWAALLATDPDPEQDVVRRRDDGSEGRAPMSIRLSQVLHHGTDHRSQICTALTTLGITVERLSGHETGVLVDPCACQPISTRRVSGRRRRCGRGWA